ncbi:MAG: DedA family protein [Prevotellaceae bacterium]|jgi:membrane protein DedA with SNARE-associated domain|nr:DedA family protein [Prevotellaceae bacterium]
MLEHFTSIQSVVEYFNAIDAMHIYLLVFALMVVESSFIPFPSEVIIPPAAMIAATPGSSLHVGAIVLFGTLGAMVGSYINYLLGWFLGRPIIHKLADTRFAHACLIDRAKIEKSETYFVKHGNSSTFVGRFIPGIRQLISIPAGISKMRPGAFTLYTFLGAAAWNVILATIGYVCGRNIEMFESIFRELTIALVAVGVLFVAYLAYNGVRKKKKA